MLLAAACGPPSEMPDGAVPIDGADVDARLFDAAPPDAPSGVHADVSTVRYVW